MNFYSFFMGENMIYINTKILNRNIKYVLCDFDRTISKGDSSTSWGVFAESPIVDPLFLKDTEDLHNKYRPIELDNTLSSEEKNYYMTLWPIQQVKLFSKYGINSDLYYEIVNKYNDIILRHDFANFVFNMYQLKIPIYIASAGLMEPIIAILKKNNCLLSNVKVIANSILVKHKKIIGLQEPIIHSFNKEDISLPFNQKVWGLLFGDLPSDKKLAKNLSTINVGFVNNQPLQEYQKEFDIALTAESSFDQVGKILFKGYQKK